MKLLDQLQEVKALTDEASAVQARAASESRDLTVAELQAVNAKLEHLPSCYRVPKRVLNQASAFC